MSTGTGTVTAKDFKEATPEQVKHLLETHLRIFIDQTHDEVYITYSLKCDDGDCPFPVSRSQFACAQRGLAIPRFA